MSVELSKDYMQQPVLLPIETSKTVFSVSLVRVLNKDCLVIRDF